MRIYDYPLMPAGAAEVTLMMPPCAIIGVSAHSRTGTIYVHARTSSKDRNGTNPRHFRIVPSGADFDAALLWVYIGTVEYGCDWVHVFEDMRVRIKGDTWT